MDDDRLASELERRASGASPRPDWAQRDLLPAVWREIDARPQPVLASRWSPLAGLATLIVALLVLVIAVPRLAPQPPSATSTPTNPLVLTTADFASRLASGELDGQTVLVDGGIVAYDGPPIFGPVCGGPARACMVGQLEGLDPRVVVFSEDVAVASAADSILQLSPGWPWWARVAPPIRGTLLFSVDQPGGVEYVGRVVPNRDQLTLSVGDANALDVNSLGRDEVVLVDGWLVDTEPPGSFMNIDCVPRQFPDLDGLPSRYCQPADYLSSEQPTGELVPDSAAQLQVQRAAAKTFGGRNANDSATYAIAPRLYGGGCSAAPPCWLWNVVARVDVGVSVVPTPSPSRTPSATPSQTQSPSPSPAANAIECAPLPDSQLPPGNGTAMVHDSTGLVDSCEMVASTGSESDPPVLNSEGDPSVIVVRWFGRPCDADSDLFLRPTSEPGYTFEVEVRMYNTTCRSSYAAFEARLHLSSPLDASAIYSWSTRVTPPSPTPSPAEPSARNLSCGPDSMGSDISIVDHSGLLSACVTGSDNPPTPAAIHVVNGIDIEHLEVAWLTDSHLFCGSHPAELEFWGPGKHLEDWMDQFLPNYVMRVARLDTTGPCSEGSRTQRVELAFSEPVSAFDVEAFVSDLAESAHSNSGTVTAETTDGTFNLLIGAGLWDFAADEPIDISAYIEYEGPAQSLTVSGQPVPILGFEQLDGDLEVYPGPTTAMCPPDDLVLRRRVLVHGRFEQSQYVTDGQLRLPPGTYRVFAADAFNVGSNCTGDHVALRTSIVILVR